MNNLKSTDRLLVFIGPSGVGKSTIVAALVESGIIEVTPTWTDRPKRPGEVELEHRFTDTKTLDRMAVEGYFAHTPLQLFGLPYKYASPKIAQPLHGRVPAVMARAMAIELANTLYPNSVIYQIETTQDEVAKRLAERAKEGSEIGTRLDDYDAEIKAGRNYAMRIFSNTKSVDEAVAEIVEAIKIDFPSLRSQQ